MDGVNFHGEPPKQFRCYKHLVSFAMTQALIEGFCSIISAHFPQKEQYAHPEDVLCHVH